MASKFFNTDADRNLWIKLNAERISYYNCNVLKESAQDLGSVDKLHSIMYISKNQLDYDEVENNKPRFSLEEFLSLTDEEILELAFVRGQHPCRIDVQR